MIKITSKKRFMKNLRIALYGHWASLGAFIVSSNPFTKFFLIVSAIALGLLFIVALINITKYNPNLEPQDKDEEEN